MKISHTLTVLFLGGLVASCYPLYPPQQPLPPVDKPVEEEVVATDEASRQMQEARERLERERMEREGILPGGTPPLPHGAGNTRTEVKTIPFATPVPGRPGFVFNPYTNNQVNVTGLPSGMKVMDPHDPDKEKHVFKVP